MVAVGNLSHVSAVPPGWYIGAVPGRLHLVEGPAMVPRRCPSRPARRSAPTQPAALPTAAVAVSMANVRGCCRADDAWGTPFSSINALIGAQPSPCDRVPQE